MRRFLTQYDTPETASSAAAGARKQTAAAGVSASGSEQTATKGAINAGKGFASSMADYYGSRLNSINAQVSAASGPTKSVMTQQANPLISPSAMAAQEVISAKLAKNGESVISPVSGMKSASAWSGLNTPKPLSKNSASNTGGGRIATPGAIADGSSQIATPAALSAGGAKRTLGSMKDYYNSRLESIKARGQNSASSYENTEDAQDTPSSSVRRAPMSEPMRAAVNSGNMGDFYGWRINKINSRKKEPSSELYEAAEPETAEPRTAGMVPVRAALRQAGISDAAIGWNPNTGMVTVNGADYILPGAVTDDGTAYADPNDVLRAVNRYNTNQNISNGNMRAIRSELEKSLSAAGVTPDMIGWNPKTGMVTVNGRDFIKPKEITDEGTSYTSSGDLFNAVSGYYASKGLGVIGAKDYVSNTLGLKNAVTWSDGNLMIGGRTVPVAYVDDDGTAYAPQSAVDAAVEAYKEQAGITGNQEVYDDWYRNYGKKLKSTANSLLDADEWEYDLENDEAYKAYRDMYTREGNRAMQNAYADLSANMGGYGSSAAAAAAAQQYNYYMQQLADRIPELQKNDYQRYLSERQLRQQAFDSYMNLANSAYSKAYQANRDAINDANEANYQNWLRDTDARDYNRKTYESDRDYDRKAYEGDRNFDWSRETDIRNFNNNNAISDRDFNYKKDISDRQWSMDEPVLSDRIAQSAIDTANYSENAALDMAAKRLANEGASYANNSTVINNMIMQLQYMLAKYQYLGTDNEPITKTDAEALGIVDIYPGGNYPSINQIIRQYASRQAAAEKIDWDEYGKIKAADERNINIGMG